ncbi:MAG: oligopeptide ABC transporter permease OppB [Hasllibacter sp.]
MLAYAIKRILVAIPVLLILISVSYVIMVMAPGGPTSSERTLPAAVIANIEARYGLDQPLWKQIYDYVENVVLRFDFGPSFQRRDLSVNDMIAQGFPVTLTYGALSFVVAVAVGVPLGILAAVRQNTWLDYLAVGFSVGAQVLPNFVMAPILVVIFTVWLGWLPAGGWNGGAPENLVLPVIALSTSFMASIARLTRSSMLETLNSGFIRTAKAKGLPTRKVILRHALKPAMLPVVSYLGPTFVGMITGSVVIDYFFSTGGIGGFLVNGALNRDYAVIMGITILIGTLTILFNLLVDLAYAWIDPRIRY